MFRCVYIGLAAMVLIFNCYIFWGKYKYLLSRKHNGFNMMLNIHAMNYEDDEKDD